jgi:hypothetical protein
MAKWLTRRSRNLRIAGLMGSSTVRGQTVISVNEHSLLSTGWFKDLIPECFNKLIAFNTVELKLIGIVS